MLLLDAMEHAPTLLVVLTARTHLERPDCTDHLRQLRRSLRRQWPAIEWAVLVEFQRRGALHLNLLVKNVAPDQAAELHAAICAVWCSRVDAVAAAQSVTPIYAVGGAVKYVSQHFMKPAQAPPEGWQGHRYSSTRGYLVRPARIMREEARTALKRKRELWRLREAAEEQGVTLLADELEEFAARTLEVRAGQKWELVQILDLAGSSAPATRLRRPPVRVPPSASRRGGTGAPPATRQPPAGR